MHPPRTINENFHKTCDIAKIDRRSDKNCIRRKHLFCNRCHIIIFDDAFRTAEAFVASLAKTDLAFGELQKRCLATRFLNFF